MTRVQGIGGRSVGSVDSFGLAFPSNVTAGNLITAGGACYNTASITAGAYSDTLANTYAMDVELTAHTGTSCAIASAPNIAGGACTVTLNVTGNNFYALDLNEWSGAATASVFDIAAEASGTSTTPATGSFTAGATGLAYGFMSQETGGTITITVGSGWTESSESEDTSNVPYGGEYRSTTASLSYNADWTLGASGAWVAVVANYKDVAVAPRAQSITIAQARQHVRRVI